MLETLTSVVPWWVFCTIFAIGAAAYGILLRYIPNDCHPSASSALFSGIAALIHICLTCLLPLFGQGITYDALGIAMAIVTGLGFVLLDLTIIATYRRGAPVTLAMPLVRIVSSLGAFVIGIIFFAEILDPLKAAGMCISLIGIYLLSQKPKATA
jgi:drug/metabolite transporter (DMT)-like permease